MRYTNIVLTVVLISMVPGFEGRYAAPLAIAMGMSVWVAVTLSFFASLIPAAIIIVLGTKIIELLEFISRVKHLSFLAQWVLKVVKRAQTIVKSKYEALGYLGLAAFVAVPLPMTGVWTASIGASLLDLDKFKSFISISFGNLIAILITSGILTSITAIYR